MPVSHTYVNPIPDRPEDAAAGKVLPSHWNAPHTISVDLATEVTGTLDPSHLTGVVNSVTANDVSLTISPTTGAVLANVNLGNAFVWTAGHTFNNTSPTFGTMTLGSVFFAGTGGQLTQDNAKFFWDNSNKRLGVGMNTPSEVIYARIGGDRAVVAADYTGTAASVTSGAGFNASFNGAEKVNVGWLSPTNTSTGLNVAPVSVVHSLADGLNIYTDAAKDIVLATNGVAAGKERLRILGAAGSGSLEGNIGIATSNPTAKLHLPAGTTTAGSAPLKLTSGSLNTSAEAGAVEFLTDKFYGTISTGSARKEFALADAALTSGRVPYLTTNGRLTDTSTFLFNGTQLLMGATSHADQYYFSGSTNGRIALAINNQTNNTGAYAALSVATAGTVTLDISSTGSSFTPSGMFLASSNNIVAQQTAGLAIVASHASGTVRIATGGTATTNERFGCDAAGNVTIGNAAIATNATDGHFYIPTCAGTPTGTPTAKTGRTAIIWDSTNKKLYVRDVAGSAWVVMN